MVVSLHYPYGIYNVVNPEPITTADILKILSDHGLGNDKWEHVELEELYKNTKTQRSNCVLSDDKIRRIDLKLPTTVNSLVRCVQSMKQLASR